MTTKKVLVTMASVIALGGVAVVPSYYFYNKYQQLKTTIDNPEEASKMELKTLVNTVSKLIELPKDEQPTIATVSDKEKLKDQQFFARSENGDKVLLYTNAKKAILYRPSLGKVIEVAPINLGETQVKPEVAGVATESAKTKIALFNGTSTVGLTNKAQAKILGSHEDLAVALKANATKNDYTKSLVVDLSGKQSELAKKLAAELGADLGVLPEGEKRPDAELLVILGSEYR